MKNYAQELFLLITTLSQLRNKDRIIQLFIESLNNVFHDYSFTLFPEKPVEYDSIVEVCTRNKNYGYISFVTSGNPDDAIFDLIRNTSQLLALLLEKLEQDELLLDQKNHLQILVDERTDQLQKVNLQLEKELTDHRQAEEALAESTTRYHTIFENSPVSLWEEDFSSVKQHIDNLKRSGITDFRTYFEEHPEEVDRCVNATRIVAVNQTTLKLFKTESKELLSKGLNVIFGKESFEIFKEELITLADGNTQFQSESVQKNLANEKLHTIIRVSIAPGYENTWKKVLVSISDITDRIRAEQKLCENEALLNATQRLSKVGGWEFNVETGQSFWTEELYRIHGLPEDSDIDHFQESLKCYRPEDRTVIHEAFQRAVEKGEAYDLEFPFTTFSGQPLWIRTTAQPVYENGKVVRVIGNLMDITERKKTDESLEKERVRMEVILSAQNTGLSLINPNMTIAWVNQKIREMFPGKEPVGQVCHLFYESRATVCDGCGTQQAFVNGKVVESEQIVPSTGRWYYIISQPVKDAAGRVVNVLEGITDITERKQKEETMQRLNRELKAISNCNQVLVRAEDEQTLLNDVCHIISNEAGYRLVWVGYAENDDAKTVRPVAWAGFDNGYVANAKLSWSADVERGRGPGGEAIRSGKITYMQDFSTEPQMAPWRESALQRGYHSVIGLPLKDENANVFGVLLIYSKLINAFTPDELRLLEELANNLAYGIIALRARDERKRAEQKAIQLTSIVESSEVAIIGKSLDGTILSWNSGAEKIYGYTENEVIGKPISILLSPNGTDDIPHILAMIKSGEHISHYETIRRRKDGRDIHVALSVSPILDTEGKIVAASTIGSDISGRKEAEKALRSASLYARSLIEASLDPLVTISEDGKITDVNHATELATGVSREQLIFSDFSDYFTEPEKARAGYRQVLAQGLVRDYPLTIRHTSGKTTDVLYNATIYKNESGELKGVFAAAHDITARKEAENALRKSENDLKEAQRLGRLGSWNWDITTDTIIWSEEYYHIYGLDPTQRPPGYEEHLKVYTPDSAARLDAAVKRNVQTGEPYEVDLELSGKMGPCRWITARSENIFDENGQIVGLRGTAQDITGRKQAEQEIHKLNQELENRVAQRTSQLEAANKELESFAYSVSHDLRAPLRSIDGFSQVLLEEYQDKVDEQGQDYLRRVRSASQRMGQLIDDILNLSRVTRSEINIQPVNLSGMFQEIADGFLGIQPERQVEFIIQKGIKAKGDSRLLQIILENLIGNAWKFTSNHPTARIEFGMQDLNNTPVYFVRDDGAGFNMKYAQKLFGAFQRLHKETEFPGTGIGLATVQRVIHRHGGKVWAEGEVEKGATFYFTLA